ncbi:MAG: helix-turn-helix domain-containing protein [Deltaproteobacteria bacterium]|nr:helix-turn-helix domain-containing protein [Deltaproteobacteria bacterium]
MFGEFIKERRIARGITLRKFCQKLDWDASNWSKVERGLLSPPQDEVKLRRIADLIGIKQGSDEWQTTKDLSRLGAQMLPEDIASNKRIVNALPLFFRTVRSDKPTAEELDRLIDLIKKEA